MPTSWESEIEVYRRAGESEADAIELVVHRWLAEGNTTALAWALMMGKPLTPRLLAYVGFMLAPSEDLDDVEVPYKLVAVARSGRPGNAKKPANFWRDLLAATIVRHLMRHGLSYEKALAQAADEEGISEYTARNAYRRWFGRGKQSAD